MMQKPLPHGHYLFTASHVARNAADASSLVVAVAALRAAAVGRWQTGSNSKKKRPDRHFRLRPPGCRRLEGIRGERRRDFRREQASGGSGRDWSGNGAFSSELVSPCQLL